MNRQPNEAEQNYCEPHILELLSAQAYTHVVCLGEIALERYTSIHSRFPLPNPLHILHPAWFLRQDYLLLDIIKAGRALRKHTSA
jgi:uracil-DNA glycosylase